MRHFLFFVFFAVIGYPISYFFQSGMVRAKMTLPEYLQHIPDVFKTLENSDFSDIGVTAIATMVVCGIIGVVLSVATASRKDAPKKEEE